MANNVKQAYAMLNGVKVPATYDEATGLWTVETTAPAESSWSQADHTYHVSLHAEDLAGNTVSMDHTDETYGDQLKIRVLEKTKPIATILQPTEGAVLGDSDQKIRMMFCDYGGSGLNLSSIALKVNGTAIPVEDLTFPASGDWEGGPSFDTNPVVFEDPYDPEDPADLPSGSYYFYEYDATGLSDGANKVEVAVTDNDGNVSDLSVENQSVVNFVISTVAPLLTILTPADNLITNDAAVKVTGKAKAGSDATSLTEVTVNGVAAVFGDVGEDGYIPFSLDITLKGGVNTITIVAKDSVGKTTSVTRTATLDTTAPVITDVHAVATTVDANGVIKITFKVTDA